MKTTLIAAMSILTCLELSVRAQDTLPTGWHKAGSDPSGYEMTIDRVNKHSGNAGARIVRTKKTSKADDFGTLMQTFKADEFRGKRLKMSAWMKTANADSAQLWMRVDGIDRTLGFDNMDPRAVKGTTGWNQYAIVLDVPEATENIAFGAFVAGNGEAWVDDFAFEVVDATTQSTNILTEEMGKETFKGSNTKYPLKPRNLNFEEN